MSYKLFLAIIKFYTTKDLFNIYIWPVAKNALKMGGSLYHSKKVAEIKLNYLLRTATVTCHPWLYGVILLKVMMLLSFAVISLSLLTTAKPYLFISYAY